MPSYTVGNRRITNVPVAGSGEYIQGIRKNTDLGIEDFTQGAPASADYDMAPVRPLRYTPGLKCDAHLESLRPSRDPRNQPIQVRHKSCLNLISVSLIMQSKYLNIFE